LFSGIANRELLLKLVPLAVENEEIFRFVVRALAISCDFDVFHELYTRFASDIERLIILLNMLTEKTPIVNEFLSWNEDILFPNGLVHSTLSLWVRGHHTFSTILKLSLRNHLITVSMDHQRLWLSVDGKIRLQHDLRNSIENWTHIAATFTPKLTTFFVNLDPCEIEINCELKSRATVCSGFDLQSMQLFRPSLTSAQVMRVFATGPLAKNMPKIIDHIMQIESQSATFVSEGFISSLCIGLAERFDASTGEFLNPVDVVFSLSVAPPFNWFASEVPLKFDIKPLIKRKWTFVPFFSALAMHGGLSLVIHIFAEVVLKYPHLRTLAFTFLHNLLNRFPFVHEYFDRENVYEMFAA
jgi:hypothetical protein